MLILTVIFFFAKTLSLNELIQNGFMGSSEQDNGIKLIIIFNKTERI
jgi:hypothetical protein